MPKGQHPKLCGARLPHSEGRLRRAAAAGTEALDRYLRRNRCRRPCTPGSTRCRLHGGLSTGPISRDGKARAAAAGVAGRARWLRELRLSGQPIPFGRKPNRPNRSIEEIERAAREKRLRRQAREMLRQMRAERKARR
jgi:hypothetical protein